MLTPQAHAAIGAWARLMGAHAEMTRAFNARLHAASGLTVTDFEVLRRLGAAPDGVMRRVDLAHAVGLTPSGITRLLDGLQRSGLVCKRECASDARVTYAAITADGRRALQDAAEVHLTGLVALFDEHFSEDELATLAELLGRLPGAEEADGSCPTTS